MSNTPNSPRKSDVTRQGIVDKCQEAIKASQDLLKQLKIDQKVVKEQIDALERVVKYHNSKMGIGEVEIE